MTYILIFKTNIESDYAKRQVKSILNEHSSIINWNIDKEDIDNVLRIESTINNSKDIISKIKQAGFICEELPD